MVVYLNLLACISTFAFPCIIIRSVQGVNQSHEFFYKVPLATRNVARRGDQGILPGLLFLSTVKAAILTLFRVVASCGVLRLASVRLPPLVSPLVHASISSKLAMRRFMKSYNSDRLGLFSLKSKFTRSRVHVSRCSDEAVITSQSADNRYFDNCQLWIPYNRITYEFI